MDTSSHCLNHRGTRSQAAKMKDESLSNQRTPFFESDWILSQTIKSVKYGFCGM